MHKNLAPIYLLAVALSMMACNKQEAPAPAPEAKVDIAAESQAVRDTETAWAKDWQTKDVEKVASYYSPDAVLLIANEPAMQGSDAIKDGIAGMFKDPHLSLTFAPSVVVVAKGDDLAYTQGVYTMTYSDPKKKVTLIEKGKYVTVYKKQADGSWKAVEDSVNPDAPAKPAPASETPAAKT
jgi:uncharacterized protein (TIGR02246 family)